MDGLKVSYQKPVEMEMDKDDLSNEGVVFTNENVIIFTSLYDKKAGGQSAVREHLRSGWFRAIEAV
jgi:hypothetical protein